MNLWPFAGLDLVTTLFELTGCSLSAPVCVRSRARYLKKEKDPSENKVLSEIEVHAPDESDFKHLAVAIMLLRARWKHVRNRFGVDELHDMEEDQAEMENLARNGQVSDLVSRLQADMRIILSRQRPGPYLWAGGYN